ncbi:MAG: OmpH family outer membrane protein [Planctomycetes bacterium]|nr:OmpH family outer membrane protein [Planctomycetota bacterium]
MNPTRLWIAGALVLGLGTALVFAQTAKKEFKPPRVAVVDISEIFERYEKKKRTEDDFLAEKDKAETEYNDIKKKLERVNEELKLLQPGSEEHQALFLQKARLEYQLEYFQKKLTKEFLDKRNAKIREIVDEITHEIERYAKGHELDLVLEKKFSAESRGQAALNWPLVYYARPEIEITEEIIGILNSQFTKGTGVPPNSGGGKK